MKLDCILEIHCLAPLQLKKNYNIKFKASNLNTIKNGKKESKICVTIEAVLSSFYGELLL